MLTLESARVLAHKLGAQYGADRNVEFVAAAYETVLSRSPSDEEVAVCVDFLARHEESDAGDDLHAKQDLLQVLLNHNDFVTIR